MSIAELETALASTIVDSSAPMIVGEEILRL